MSISSVQSHTKYWKNSDPSPWRLPPSVVLQPVGNDRSLINNDITTLYGSQTGAAMLEAITSGGRYLRIGETTQPTGYVPAQNGGDEFIRLNVAQLNGNGYFTTQGTYVQDSLLVTLAHEFSHYQAYGGADPDGKDAQINAGGYDFYGFAITQQNQIMTELSHADLLQAGYQGGTDASVMADNGINIGVNYTHGEVVDVVRLGSNAEAGDILDMTQYGNSRDLIFGFYYNDTITGGGGDDHLFGCQGNDLLSGGDGNDYLYGNLDATDPNAASYSVNSDGGTGKDVLFSGYGGGSLQGGNGDDNLVLMPGSTATLAGGSGNDSFWIPLQIANTAQAQILDADSGDKLYWNGYKLNGGTSYHVEAEGNGTSYWWSHLGSHGIVYDFFPLISPDLSISLPDGSSIVLNNFANGDCGITLTGEQIDVPVNIVSNDDLYPDLPYSNICYDGQQGNWVNLSGRGSAVKNPGSNLPPQAPLFTPPPPQAHELSGPSNASSFLGHVNFHPFSGNLHEHLL